MNILAPSECSRIRDNMTVHSRWVRNLELLPMIIFFCYYFSPCQLLILLMCRLAAKFCSLLVNELWQEITGQWLVLKLIVNGPRSRNVPDQWIWRPSSAVVKDDGKKKVEQSCITLGVTMLLEHVLKLNLRSYFFGLDKDLGSGKICHSWPKKPCVSLEIPCFTWQSTAIDVLHTLSHRVWWTLPQVQRSSVSFGNHLNYEYLGEWAAWAMQMCPSGGWGIITLSPHHQLQGVQVEKGWLSSLFLWKGAGLCCSCCSLPAASLIHIPELKPSLLPAHPSCRKSCGSLKPLLKHLGPLLCGASSLSSASCFFFCWCWDFSWTLRSLFQAPLGY